MEFIQKSDWLEVEYRENSDGSQNCPEGEDSLQPCFYYNEAWHYLSDFYRCHDNPWGNVNVPEYIHGYDMKNYWSPIYIQVNDSGDFVKVYEKC